MNGDNRSIERRSFLGKLGQNAAILGVASRYPTPLQAAEDKSWNPARHTMDDWLDNIPGKHRMVFDSTLPDNMALAFHFTSIYFAASRRAYQLEPKDLACVIVLRHKSTAFGYNDAMWAKYGKFFSQHANFTDPTTKEIPKTNAYLELSGEGIKALINRGVNFAVCQMSAETISRMIAMAVNGEPDHILAEMNANLIGNAHPVPAGIVALNRAQEKGYSVVG